MVKKSEEKNWKIVGGKARWERWTELHLTEEILRTKRNMRTFGVIPFIKLQNDS